MTKQDQPQPPTTVELLYFDGCPNYELLLARLQAILTEQGIPADIDLRRVESEQEASQLRFLGSPTARIDGRDVDATAEDRHDFGLKCRLYKTANGVAGVPPDEWIRDTIRRRTTSP